MGRHRKGGKGPARAVKPERRRIYIFSHYINIIGIGKKLTCPIQYQTFLVLLDPPDGVFQSKVEKQW
jgi:hypothetical protein